MSAFDGVLIHVDGKVETVHISDFRGIQVAVGGHFDLVCSASYQTSFWVNDEGKLIGLPINPVATAVLWKLNPAFANYDVLCGPVLISGGSDDEGETLSVNSEALETLAAMSVEVNS